MIMMMMIRRARFVGAGGAETHEQLEHTSQVFHQVDPLDVDDHDHLFQCDAHQGGGRVS